MHDGIELEKRRIPAAVIATDLFSVSVKVQASVAGIPDYPVIITPHPISRLDEAESRERARAAAPEVGRVLLKR